MKTTTETPSTRNITRVFRLATPEQVAIGEQWYTDANTLARAFATQYGQTIETTSGILAALSPQNSWGNNVNLAARFLENGGLTSGYLGVGLRKAQAILDGVAPETVLTSSKINSFYKCILTAGHTDAVCIDRHAYDVAVNVRHVDQGRPDLRGKRYEETANAYRRAARIVGLPASMVQSVTWVAWRNRFWADGAFDGYSLATA